VSLCRTVSAELLVPWYFVVAAELSSGQCVLVTSSYGRAVYLDTNCCGVSNSEIILFVFI
jgi:hypothetical protein